MSRDDDEDYDEKEDKISELGPSLSVKASSTATEALASKFSAVSLKYFDDQFLQLMFEVEAQGKKLVRKPPIINRGYYTRVKVIEKLVNRFLHINKSSPSLQIVSLGGGFDTLAYNLFDRINNENHTINLKIFEIDFTHIITKKASFTMRNDVFSKLQTKLLEESSSSVALTRPYGYYFGNYRLLTADLRRAVDVQAALLESGADIHIPTLFITECVLVYISKQDTSSLLHTLSTLFTHPNTSWVSYDMIHPTDVFGKRMLDNLTRAGHSLPGFVDYPTLSAHETRFTEAGWVSVKASDMLTVYNNMITAAEKEHVDGIERLDEVEEWRLIMTHYSLTIATKGDEGLLASVDIPA